MITCTFFRTLVLLLILTAAAPAAGAAVLTLGACTPEALRALIAGAVDGDLLLLPACTISVSGAAGDDANLSGDFDIATSITLQGAGPDATILDGAGLDRVLDIRPGTTVVIADLTIRNGAAPGTEDGGGIRNDEVLTLLDVLVTGNTTGGKGGGVACTFASTTLTIRRSRITGNSAGGSGGGIGSDVGCDVLIEASAVAGNSAGGVGGGIDVAARTVTVRNSTVADNSAALDGGGLQTSSGATLLVEHSTVSGNAAGASGGGLAIRETTGTLRNTTVVYNRSGGDGGGISLPLDPIVTIVNSTIARNTDAGNQATGAGGIANDLGILNIRNSVIAENTVGPGTPAGNADVAVADLNENLSNFIGTADGTPRLSPLQDNGGRTFTMAPFSGSPLIDTGDNALVSVRLTTDQRGAGFARIVDGDGNGTATVDRGAVEVAASTGPANAVVLFVVPPVPVPADTVVLEFVIRAPGRTIVGGAALFDGVDISQPLVGCPLLAGTLISGEQTFTCTFPAFLLPPGVHTFSLILNLDDGTILTDMATIGTDEAVM